MDLSTFNSLEKVESSDLNGALLISDLNKKDDKYLLTTSPTGEIFGITSDSKKEHAWKLTTGYCDLVSLIKSEIFHGSKVTKHELRKVHLHSRESAQATLFLSVVPYESTVVDCKLVDERKMTNGLKNI